MRANATKVEPAVQTAMLACLVTPKAGAWHLTLPQLEPKLYKKVAEALQRLGGKWSRKDKALVFDHDPGPGIRALCDEGLVPKKNPLAFFETPTPVIDRMIQVAQAHYPPQFTGLLLEPSAGLGALADRMRIAWPNSEVICYEADPRRCDVLVKKDHHVVSGDFLDPATAAARDLYDVVLMNPPFAVEGNPTAYVDHAQHAFEVLAPGGILVAVVPAVLGQDRSHAKLAGFEGWVEDHGSWEALPDHAFRESGTDVRCALVTLRKPLQ